MAVKKYLSLEKLTEYDSLLKSKISQDDASTLSSSKSYTDQEVNKIKAGSIVVKEAEHADSADSATKATQDGNGAVISSTYETKTDASSKLDEAKQYTDTIASGKSDSNHNHDSAYDSKGSAANALSSAKSYTDQQIDAIVGDGAADTLDTIGEISAALKGNAGIIDTLASKTSLDSHTNNGDIHVTTAKKNNWDSAYSHSTQAHAPSNAEKNQNAFSNIKVGNTTVAAGGVTDTLNLIAGDNITLTPSASGKSVTIYAKDTITTVDTSMSDTSTNPVQNKVISGAIADVAESVLLNANTISTHTQSIQNLQTAVDSIQEITSAEISQLFQ